MTPDALYEITERLRTAGMLVEEVQADGHFHRCPTIDKPNRRNGSYMVAEDLSFLFWMNFRTGDKDTWHEQHSEKISPAEQKRRKARLAKEYLRAREERERHYKAAAKVAASVWAGASPAETHPYLKRKCVTSYGLRKLASGELLIPVYGMDGDKMRIQSLQRIFPAKLEDGTDKRTFAGGRMEGGFFPIPAADNDKSGPLLIAEGYATAASACMATGYAALVAFSAVNLTTVGQMARRLYPQRSICFLADNDCSDSEGLPRPDDKNTGLLKAREAAQSIGATVALCPAPDGKKADFNDLHLMQGKDAVKKVIIAALQEDADRIPKGFTLHESGKHAGLWYTECKGDSEPVQIWIGPPLLVRGKTRDKDSKEWGLLLEWHDPDGQPHSWAMPRALLMGRDSSSWLSRLGAEGWEGSSLPKARQLLAQYLDGYQTSRRARCVHRSGWHDGIYVFPDGSTIPPSFALGQVGQLGQPYSPNEKDVPNATLPAWANRAAQNSERIVVQLQSPDNPFRLSGTLEEWQKYIAAPAWGNSRLVLALCASFASVLLDMAGHESCGFNFVGASSTGKTTALRVAASVWGKGDSDRGYIGTWRSTSNGLEGVAALHSDAALCLDELGQASARTVDEATYMLGNGQGKLRASQDGSARAVRSWRCMLLSTGEKGLEDKLAEDGLKVQAGQRVRLVDIPADAGADMGIFENLHDAPTPQAFSLVLKEAAMRYYGHPSRFFLNVLVQNREELQNKILLALRIQTDRLCPAQSSGQVKRVARHFALCIVAGGLAVESGLVPSWTEEGVCDAVKKCFDSWLLLRGDAGNAEDMALVERIRLFLEQQATSRFQPLGNGDAPLFTIHDRVGFWRNGRNGMEFYVLPQSFKTELCRGFNFERAKKVLHEQGWLKKEGTGFQTKVPVLLEDGTRPRCYLLTIPDNEEECTNVAGLLV